MSGRRPASKSRAPQRRAPTKSSRGKKARRQPQRRSAHNRRRTLILLGLALAGAAALLWGVVRVGSPSAQPFRIAPTPASSQTQPVEIEESERREMDALIEQLDKGAKQ